MFDEFHEEDKRRAFQFTKEYENLTDEEKETLKLEIPKAPCNIWGYIMELEERIKKLEETK